MAAAGGCTAGAVAAGVGAGVGAGTGTGAGFGVGFGFGRGFARGVTFTRVGVACFAGAEGRAARGVVGRGALASEACPVENRPERAALRVGAVG